MVKGSLSDGHWVSTFQGRLINFEKRRKVNSCSPDWGRGGKQTHQGRTLDSHPLPLRFMGYLDRERRGSLPTGGWG